ncbi:MAG: hypothetical protein HY744_32720 [Deltaproteobacteria bacterium]|nr:hypothetical protein [Deltaproteobacteria bacterium]
MATAMARLLCRGDAAELGEAIERWLAEAPTGPLRQQYEALGTQLLELKQALAQASAQPTEQELELALTMMLRLAAASPAPGK